MNFLHSATALSLAVTATFAPTPAAPQPDVQQVETTQATKTLENVPDVVAPNIPNTVQWPLGATAPLPKRLDYSSLKKLAISASYPLYYEGRSVHPSSKTGGGHIDAALASSNYKSLKAHANTIAKDHGNDKPPADNRNFADCGAFVSSLLISTVDPQFPGLIVDQQREYLHGVQNKWKRVGITGDGKNDDLKIGDIFISNDWDGPDHIFIWLGTVHGEKNIIANASYGKDGSTTAHLPALEKNPIRRKGKDHMGRTYEIWRNG